MTTIDTIIDDARDVLRLIEPALAAIAAIQAAVGVGGIAAERAVAVVRAALGSFEAVAAGAATREQALAALAKLRDGLAANDATADVALEGRFVKQ